MTVGKAICLGVAASFAWSLAAISVAAEPSLDAARRCGTVADNFSRLACFDNLFRPAAGSVTAPPAASAPKTAPAPAAGAAPVVVTGAAAAAFGEEALKSNSDRAAESAGAPSEMTAKVTQRNEISEKRYRLTLDNGQVWQQEETQRKTMPEVEVGDTVRIQKRSFGSYLMAPVSNGKATNWLRVSRLK